MSRPSFDWLQEPRHRYGALKMTLTAVLRGRIAAADHRRALRDGLASLASDAAAEARELDLVGQILGAMDAQDRGDNPAPRRGPRDTPPTVRRGS